MGTLPSKLAGLAERWRWSLLILGLIGLALAAWLFFGAPKSPPPAQPASAHVVPLAVIDAKGERLGWLDIRYPRTLRENQDGPVEVRYVPDQALWRAHPAWAQNLKLAAAVTGAGFNLKPEPLTYTFDGERVMAGGDSHIWLLSPQHEGDYSLLVTLTAQPDKFRVTRFVANGASMERPDEAVLPVTVVTAFNVPGVAVDLAKGAAALVSFLFTLPAGLAAIRGVFKRKPARRGRRRG